MTLARVVRIALAGLCLLVAAVLVAPTSGRTSPHHAAVAASTGCDDHAAAARISHHATTSPCAPLGEIPDHRHCPACPAGGGCSDVATGVPAVVAVLVAVRPAAVSPSGDATGLVGRNPLPDPRPPRRLV